MWRRRRQEPEPGGEEPADVYRDLRAQLFSLEPADAALSPTDELPNVFGTLMEIGFPEGVATVVALADGSTSMYTSTGGGVIGAGEHEEVARQTRAFLATIEEHLELLDGDEGEALPPQGEVWIRALTYAGRRGARVGEEDLGSGRHPLSAVFFAGHEVIGALRQVEEPGR